MEQDQETRHTLEELRNLLKGYTWEAFMILFDPSGRPIPGDNPKNIQGVAFSVILGPYLGRPAIACVAEGKFVALSFFVLSYARAMDSERFLPLDPSNSKCFLVEGWGDWYLPGSFNHEALIVPENGHESQDSDLHTRAVAAAPCP